MEKSWDQLHKEVLKAVLDTIDGQGYIGTDPRTSNEIFTAIDELEEAGTIETLTKAGVVFMNSDWSYVRTGNPQNVQIVSNEYGCSWPEPEKGIKS